MQRVSSNLSVREINGKSLLLVLVLLSITAVILAGALQEPLLLAIPGAVLFGAIVLFDYRKLYFILWATIPLSTEIEIGSVGIDFPDELLMIVLMFVSLIIFLKRGPTMDLSMLLNPVSLLLMVHMSWLAITSMSSTVPLYSVKFLLSKIWYVVTFFFMTYHILRNEKDVGTWLKWLLFPTFVTVLVVLVRHSSVGFSFREVNTVLNPFYRNHVDYALMLGALFPFAWIFRRHLGKYAGLVICGTLLIGIYFAYTRAAYIGLVAAFAGILLIRLHLVKYVSAAALIGAICLMGYLFQNNRYIDYAPDFHKTITHYEFDNLIEATYNLEDISTMERVYRWIAGCYMIADKPWLGFGPGTFYSKYKSFTDEHFITYVSDNPEKSGIHNYFLMTAAEQGLPGLLLFTLLLFVTLLKAQWLYKRVPDGFPRDLVYAVTGSLFFIIFALLLNDMIETDKIGTTFFLCLALLVMLEARYTRRRSKSLPNPEP